MPAISDTAYPRFQIDLTSSQSLAIFIPTEDELSFAKRKFSGTGGVITCLLMLKCFQRLGYFPNLMEIPYPVIERVCQSIGVSIPDDQELERHGGSAIRQRQRITILKFLKVKPFSVGAASLIKQAIEREVVIKDDLVDLINIGIEEAVRCSYELPGFSTLLEMAKNVRAVWSENCFSNRNWPALFI
jgi:hypothetical protein